MSRKSVRQNVNRLRLIRAYTMDEISKVLNVHVRTVQIWRKSGLNPIDETDRPLLFIGEDVRKFLKPKKKPKNENPSLIYCVKCRNHTQPSSDSIWFKFTCKKIGKNAKSIHIKGKCSECNTTLTSFGSTESIKSSPYYAKYKEAEKRLIDISNPSLNTDKREVKNNG